MAMVLAALLPSAVAGVIIFGLRAAAVLIICVASCVIFEALFCAVTKRPHSAGDFSAAVTGLLLGMSLTSSIPFYIAVIGSFIAIVIVKQLFGGLGQNFANPAVTARIALGFSFAGEMTSWVNPNADAATGATPLAAGWLDATGSFLFLPDGMKNYKMAPFTLKELLLGAHGGCIGEVCSIALILGGLLLIVTRIASPAAPVSFIGSLAALTFIYTGDINVTVYQLLTGGLLIGAFFMATDYTTTPLTAKGKIIFGLGCGIFTFIIRNFAGYPEGVSFSILLMNLLTPHIDRLTRTAPFGAAKPKKETA
jgi:electron transport complex protein RnfD